ncbi:hypothetical protein FOZ61_004845, partial [Perkinsus olseni]
DEDKPEELETLEIQESLLKDQLRRAELDVAKLEEDSLLILRAQAQASVRSRASSSVASSQRPFLSVDSNENNKSKGEGGDKDGSTYPLGKAKVTETTEQKATVTTGKTGVATTGINDDELPVRRHPQRGDGDRPVAMVNKVRCRSSVRSLESQLMECEEVRNCK